jgi:sialic acid synthase SpsE
MTDNKRTEVSLGGQLVGDGHPVAIVAELGVNHLGDYGRMKEMIHAAHEAGADFLKFQTYIAEKRYNTATNPKAGQFIEWLAAWQFTHEQESELWQYANSLGARVLTSPFDADSVDFADGLGSLAFKLAAFEVVNLALVRAIASKGKPIILSRGMATDDEIRRATDIMDTCKCPYIILHTISSYPLEKKYSHLRMIPALRAKYNCPIGHSDHTVGTEIPPLAVAAGANMIEKHFTVAPKLRESDNFFSITADDLKELIFKVRQVETYMGSGDIVKIDTEDFMWDFRRPSD